MRGRLSIYPFVTTEICEVSRKKNTQIDAFCMSQQKLFFIVSHSVPYYTFIKFFLQRYNFFWNWVLSLANQVVKDGSSAMEGLFF